MPQPPQSQTPAGSNLEKDLNDLDRKLVDLKTKYDQYFIGLEKLEPRRLRDEVAGLVKKYAGVQIQNTSHKFRYNTLVSRYNSFQMLWSRSLRELEEGNYKRDLFKQKLQEQEQQPQSKAAATDAAAGKAKSKTVDPFAMLFQQYVDARKKNHENTQGLTRELLEGQLKKQAAALKEKFNCKRVTFKVVVEDGKAKIKALPKND